MARQALAEAFQAPARDNPAGRPAWALGNRAEVGQAAQVAEPGNPVLGELFQDLRSSSLLDGYSIHSRQAWMERKSRPDAN